jgi:energy-coupling factor transporter ATP-binding protein EcfA2
MNHATPPLSPPQAGGYALAVENLSYRYDDGTHALTQVSFRIADGERVGLIGPNGAGKSTLLLHLNGLLPDHLPADNPVHVFDLPITAANALKIRSQVGLLFQDPDDQLFCPTVWEDVAFGPRQFGLSQRDVAEKVANALQMVGLSGFEKRSPHRLSRGEKRRVCLAGVLACDAKILVLDEPTSDLDPRSRGELMEILRRLPVAQLIASHDLEFVVQTCSRVLVLDRGELVADGETTTLLADEPLMLKHGLERPHILQHLHPHIPSHGADHD